MKIAIMQFPHVIANEVQRNDAICPSLPTLRTKRSEVKHHVVASIPMFKIKEH